MCDKYGFFLRKFFHTHDFYIQYVFNGLIKDNKMRYFIFLKKMAYVDFDYSELRIVGKPQVIKDNNIVKNYLKNRLPVLVENLL